MKLLYVTSIRYPSTLANRQQVLSMSREFARALGGSFTLGVSAVRDPEPGITYAEMPGSARSVMLAWRYVSLIRRGGFTHVFCRESRLFALMTLYARLRLVRATFIFELHDAPEGAAILHALRAADGIVAVTGAMRDDIERLVPHARVHVAPGAVDLARFTSAPEKREARSAHAIPEDEKTVVYAGSIGCIPPWDYNPWKGVDVLLDAARMLTYRTRIIGGEADEIAELRKRYPEPQIVFMGKQDAPGVAAMLRAADVLVLPNKSGYSVAERYTSPLKLFEYMASGTPIVASDLPSARELLAEDECFFFAPNDPASLAATIERALADPKEAEARAARASARVESLTWEARAAGLVRFMQSLAP